MLINIYEFIKNNFQSDTFNNNDFNNLLDVLALYHHLLLEDTVTIDKQYDYDYIVKTKGVEFIRYLSDILDSLEVIDYLREENILEEDIMFNIRKMYKLRGSVKMYDYIFNLYLKYFDLYEDLDLENGLLTLFSRQKIEYGLKDVEYLFYKIRRLAEKFLMAGLEIKLIFLGFLIDTDIIKLPRERIKYHQQIWDSDIVSGVPREDFLIKFTFKEKPYAPNRRFRGYFPYMTEGIISKFTDPESLLNSTFRFFNAAYPELLPGYHEDMREIRVHITLWEKIKHPREEVKAPSFVWDDVEKLKSKPNEKLNSKIQVKEIIKSKVREKLYMFIETSKDNVYNKARYNISKYPEVIEI